MLSRLNRFAQQPFRHFSATLTLVFLLLFAATAVAAPGGGKGGGKPSKPTVSIATPSSGSTASGAVTVSGSASDSSTSLASVQVSVDSGAYQQASGTTSWSFPLDTASYPDGTHTIAARATDSRGNTAVTNETVTFSNSAPPPPPPPPSDTTPPTVSIATPASGSTVSGTVSVSGSASDAVGVSTVQVSVDGGAYQTAQGTSSWSYSLDTTALADGSHTLAARATDTSGNVSTTSEGITVQNSTAQTLPSGVIDQLVTPEGATIQIYSGVSNWTAQQVYDLLKPNAYQLSVIGPTLTIKVQNQYASQTTSGASSTGDPPVYSDFSATIYLKASNSSFAVAPDAVITHEYGCAWTQYYLWIGHAGDWNPYLVERNLLGNPLLDSNLNWSRTELIADDYRMLFGTQKAQDELSYINPYIPDPRTVSGLKDWFLTSWAS
jgi:Bacterial Ig domain